MMGPITKLDHQLGKVVSSDDDKSIGEKERESSSLIPAVLCLTGRAGDLVSQPAIEWLQSHGQWDLTGGDPRL